MADLPVPPFPVFTNSVSTRSPVAYGYPTPGHPVSSVLSSSLIAFIVDLFLLDRCVFFSILSILRESSTFLFLFLRVPVLLAAAFFVVPAVGLPPGFLTGFDCLLPDTSTLT